MSNYLGDRRLGDTSFDDTEMVHREEEMWRSEGIRPGGTL